MTDHCIDLIKANHPAPPTNGKSAGELHAGRRAGVSAHLHQPIEDAERQF